MKKQAVNKLNGYKRKYDMHLQNVGAVSVFNEDKCQSISPLEVTHVCAYTNDLF
jgi:hypothetical protein